MMLKLNKPLTIHQQGKRKNNEDAFFIPENGYSEQLYIVCDGVGGASKGEVASNLACNCFAEYLANTKGVKDKTFFTKALKYTEQKFTETIGIQPSCAGMGTTLVLAYFEAGKAKIVWCGDSRLYQFRDGKIIYKTKDHSFVQKLVDDGEITEAEAREHPRKNIILRAINGTENATEIDYHVIDDIKKNDVFLLCSDGIIESLSDKKLEQIIDLSGSDYPFIIEQLDSFCAIKSNDNYTCILLPIGERDKLTEPIKPSEIKKDKEGNGNTRLFFMAGFALFILSLAYYFFTGETIDVATKHDVEIVENSESSKGKISEITKSDSIKNAELAKANLLKMALNEKLILIDSIANAENDTLGKFNIVKDLERGRFYLKNGDSTLAFAALKDWVNHEWKDSLLLKKDWLNLRSLYANNLQNDSSYLKQIAICDEYIAKFIKPDLLQQTETVTDSTIIK